MWHKLNSLIFHFVCASIFTVVATNVAMHNGFSPSLSLFLSRSLNIHIYTNVFMFYTKFHDVLISFRIFFSTCSFSEMTWRADFTLFEIMRMTMETTPHTVFNRKKFISSNDNDDDGDSSRSKQDISAIFKLSDFKVGHIVDVGSFKCGCNGWFRAVNAIDKWKRWLLCALSHARMHARTHFCTYCTNECFSHYTSWNSYALV